MEVFSLKAKVLLLSNGEWAALVWAFKYCDRYK